MSACVASSWSCQSSFSVPSHANQVVLSLLQTGVGHNNACSLPACRRQRVGKRVSARVSGRCHIAKHSLPCRMSGFGKSRLRQEVEMRNVLIVCGLVVVSGCKSPDTITAVIVNYPEAMPTYAEQMSPVEAAATLGLTSPVSVEGFTSSWGEYHVTGWVRDAAGCVVQLQRDIENWEDGPAEFSLTTVDERGARGEGQLGREHKVVVGQDDKRLKAFAVLCLDWVDRTFPQKDHARLRRGDPPKQETDAQYVLNLFRPCDEGYVQEAPAGSSATDQTGAKGFWRSQERSVAEKATWAVAHFATNACAFADVTRLLGTPDSTSRTGSEVPGFRMQYDAVYRFTNGTIDLVFLLPNGQDSMNEADLHNVRYVTLLSPKDVYTAKWTDVKVERRQRAAAPAAAPVPATAGTNPARPPAW